MSDQATAVAGQDPLTDLLGAIGPGEAPEEGAEPAAEPAAPAAQADPSAPKPVAKPAEGEPATEEADGGDRYRITVKGANGSDEEREVTVAELAKGYMLQADYTRKTQEIASQRQAIEVNYQKALQEQQSSITEHLGRLQELVLAQAAPELNGVDWVSLSVSDPAKFVQLQARQQQVQQTWQALEQQKAQARQAQEQALGSAVTGIFKAADEMLAREIPGLDGPKTSKLLADLQASIGWGGDDLKSAATALAKAGMHPETLGQVLVLAHKAIQFDALQKAKPAALAKVAAAPPKAIKPAAPQPRSALDNQAATDRLRKHGRVEDLASLLPR